MLKHNSYLLWLSFSIVFFVLMAMLLPIRYEENDDIVMLLFASGQYTGTPEFRLVFINSIWGLLLKGLYSITTKIEWYSLLFALSHILSLSIIMWSIFENKANKYFKYLFALFFLVMEMRFIAQFQFTTTTAILAFSGLILTLHNSQLRIILGLSIFAISTLIRFEAAILVLLLFVPMLVKRYLVCLKKQEIKLFIYAGLVIALFYGVNQYTYHSNTEWANYYKYNKLRSAINDNPNASKINVKLFQDINYDDYSLLQSAFADYKILDLNTIRKIAYLTTSVSFTSKLNNIYPAFRKHTQIIGIVLLLTLLLSYKNNRKDNYYLFANVLLFLIVLALISLSGILKLRILWSVTLVTVYSIFHFTQSSSAKPFKWLALLVLVYLSSLLIYRTHKIVLQEDRNYLEFKKQKKLFDEYVNNYSDYVIPYLDHFNIEYYPVFKVSSLIPKKSLAFGGWVTGIPYNKNKVFTHEDLIDKNAILTNKKTFNNLSETLIKTISKNYRVDVHTQIINHKGQYLIFKVVTNQDSHKAQ